MTTPMLLMFVLGVLAGGMGGAGLWGWWLKAHSALLNAAVRDGMVATYARTPDGRSADRMDPLRYAEEGTR